jgi:hypothetical protein
VTGRELLGQSWEETSTTQPLGSHMLSEPVQASRNTGNRMEVGADRQNTNKRREKINVESLTDAGNGQSDSALKAI